MSNKEKLMDVFIVNIINEYHLAIHHIICIGSLVVAFVAICGIIRFGIAIRRRATGVYPPAASQMEGH